jgi:plasmid replication initiation protein
MKSTKQIIREELRKQYKVIKDVKDINNVRYNAKPVFGEDKTLQNSIHCTDHVIAGKTVRVFKSSPSNFQGQAPIGFYHILYRILD